MGKLHSPLPKTVLFQIFHAIEELGFSQMFVDYMLETHCEIVDLIILFKVSSYNWSK